jgi:DNA repair protein RecO (recombination protein O)
MQLVSSECIILRNQDYLERDRLVTFLTRDAGRLRGIVKGSRKLTSRGVGDFEAFARGVMFYTDRGHGGLVSIRKCDPKPPYFYLHADYHRFLYAGYFAELMDLIPIEPSGSEPYFDLLAESLAALCEPGPARRLPLLRLRFELHFLQLLGYQPDWDRCGGCGAALWVERDGAAAPAFEAPLQFDVRQGGVRCPACASADPLRLVLSPASLAFLENWRRGGAGSAVRPTRQNLEELEDAVTRHLVHHLERQPRSLALLPGLDALEAAPQPA